ncbi:uncharacterized protein K02A2.6-like [Armigeres subalbatus]|uniref:uncharacterized protein K02A2.6-like n=1 Tax=Armigeres subalbatus TaxID=124917 RepID=UPI002ED58FDE
MDGPPKSMTWLTLKFALSSLIETLYRFRQRILKQLHRGHPGMERMKAIARSHVYWPRIDDHIADFVKRCESCVTHSKTPSKVPLQSWPLAQSPWERIHIDFAGPINGLHFLIVDAFTKWPEIRIVRSPTTSAVTEFLDELFARFGVPNVIVSDNGTQFTSEQFAVLCRKNGIQHFRTSPYHPQSNGQAERFVDTFKRSLRKINEGESISESLQTFLQVYRTTPSRVLNGRTPSQLMLGRNIKTVLDLLHHQQPKPVVLNQRQQFNRKHGATPRGFRKGDMVYAKVYRSNTKWQWTSHSNQLKHRSSEATTGAADSTPLGILVDMFGIQSPGPAVQPAQQGQAEQEPLPVPSTSNVRSQVQPRTEVQVVPAVSNQEVEAGSSQLDDVPERGRIQTDQPEPEHEEDNQPPIDPVPEPPSVRPQRVIRMPSRFEPYLFWK